MHHSISRVGSVEVVSILENRAAKNAKAAIYRGAKAFAFLRSILLRFKLAVERLQPRSPDEVKRNPGVRSYFGVSPRISLRCIRATH